MTIQFQGHIQNVRNGTFSWKNGKEVDGVEVHVVTDHTICPKEMFINIPKEDATHWLVGRCVSITAYAFDPPIQPSQTNKGK